MKSLVIPIYFFNGCHFNVSIESYTKIGELKTYLMKKMRFQKNKIPYYCLYEICFKNMLIGIYEFIFIRGKIFRRLRIDL